MMSNGRGDRPNDTTSSLFATLSGIVFPIVVPVTLVASKERVRENVSLSVVETDKKRPFEKKPLHLEEPIIEFGSE